MTETKQKTEPQSSTGFREMVAGGFPMMTRLASVLFALLAAAGDQLALGLGTARTSRDGVRRQGLPHRRISDG